MTRFPHPFGIVEHRLQPRTTRSFTTLADTSSSSKDHDLDGSHGEGGGQILRTALTLSLLTGRPFRMTRIRANRDKPGLRPQHLTAVEAAAILGQPRSSAPRSVRVSCFSTGRVLPRDLTIDIGTAGSTGLVLQTLHLPLAMRADSAPGRACRGTFNPKAPLICSWTPPGAPTSTRSECQSRWRCRRPDSIPAAADNSKPGSSRPSPAWVQTHRGPLRRVHGVAGVANLRDDIARRMRDRAMRRLRTRADRFAVEIELVRWSSPGQGAALSVTGEHEGGVPATFVGLGERGKPSEEVADEAVDPLLAFEAVDQGAVDPHSADQILLPLALAEGRSIYTVSEVTEHLRTNVATIAAFLDRPITIEEPTDLVSPGRVVIG